MKARHALPSDRAVLCALGERGYSESRYGRYPLRAEKFERLAQLAQDQPESVLCIVVEQDEEIVGFMCGIVTEHYFADMIYATNLALYVMPEHRGGTACLRLVRRFEFEAKDLGADEIMLGATSGVKTDRTLRLYEALGYARIGGLAVKYLGV